MRLERLGLKIVLIGLVAITLGIAPGGIVWAKISKHGGCEYCELCHTSGGGGGSRPLKQEYEGSQGCVECHSSSESSTTYVLGGAVTVPVVYYKGTDEPDTYLAGGNFYWVAQDTQETDPLGHNVLGIASHDRKLSEAPGNPYSCGNSCHKTLQAQTALPYLGGGCEGCHLDVTHHANDHDNLEGGLVTNENGEGWYRFLSGHMSGSGHGVEGYEDGDWQATSDANDHNEYLGWVGDHEYHAGFYNLGHTMTAFCCGCHGNFHVEQGSGKWIRHPSDAVLCSDGLDGCECAGYTTYNPQAPLARPSLDGWTQPSETVDPETDLVMCLSCHRPHGSPFPKMLRWDLRGCFNCHTNK